MGLTIMKIHQLPSGHSWTLPDFAYLVRTHKRKIPKFNEGTFNAKNEVACQGHTHESEGSRR